MLSQWLSCDAVTMNHDCFGYVDYSEAYLSLKTALQRAPVYVAIVGSKHIWRRLRFYL